MGRKPVYTFAKWRVKDGQLAAVLGLLAELMAKSTAEEGSLLYKVHQSNSDANTLILLVIKAMLGGMHPPRPAPPRAAGLQALPSGGAACGAACKGRVSVLSAS